MPEPQRSAVLSYFEERFGIPLAAFAAYRLLERSKAYSLLSDSPHVEALAGLRVQSVGLPVLRRVQYYLKPTTAAVQRFGSQATRHTLVLSEMQVTTLLHEHVLPLQGTFHPGYVILMYDGHVLGCGLYTPGRLHSQIPRHQIATT